MVRYARNASCHGRITGIFVDRRTEKAGRDAARDKVDTSRAVIVTGHPSVEMISSAHACQVALPLFVM